MARSKGKAPVQNVAFELLIETEDFEPVNAIMPKIWLTLVGARGSSNECDIGKSKSNKTAFLKGQVDEFLAKTNSVGPLKNIKLRLDETTNPHVKLTIATACLTNKYAGKRYIFSVHKCMSFNEEVGSPEIVLTPSVVSDAPQSKSGTRPAIIAPKGSEAQSPRRDSTQKPDGKKESLPQGDATSPEETMDTTIKPEPSDDKTKAQSGDDAKNGNVTPSENSAQHQVKGITSLVTLMRPTLQGIIEGDEDQSSKLKSIFRKADAPATSTEDDDADAPKSKWAIFKKYTVQEMKILVGKTLHEAIISDDLERVQELMEFNPKDVSLKDERGYSPLHLACEVGTPDIAYFLCKEGADVEEETPTGYLPIQIAAVSGNLDCMKVLIDNGVEKDVLTEDGSSLLHLSARHGHLETVEWLTERGLDPAEKDKRNRTPLAWAVKFNHRQVINYLKELTPEETGSENLEEEPPPDHVIPNRLSKQFSEKMALIEKRRNFRQQRKNMSRQSSSFLDFIRSECDERD